MNLDQYLFKHVLYKTGTERASLYFFECIWNCSNKCIVNYKIKNQAEFYTFKSAAENNRFTIEKFYNKLFYDKKQTYFLLKVLKNVEKESNWSSTNETKD